MIGTYTELHNPTPALGTELAVQQDAATVISLVDLDRVLAFRDGEAGLGDLGRDAEGAAREFLQHVSQRDAIFLSGEKTG